MSKHTLIIKRTNKKTKEVVSCRVEEFLSIYNAERRKLEILTNAEITDKTTEQTTVKLVARAGYKPVKVIKEFYR